MQRTTVSVCRELRLVPIDRVEQFARMGVKAYTRITPGNYDSHAIPGSITATVSPGDGTFNMKIAYKRAYSDASAATELEELKAQRLVAFYTDEAGIKLVAGTPDWPLSLNYTTDGGVLSVSIEGSDVISSAYQAE